MKRTTTYILTLVLLLLPMAIMAQMAGEAIKRPVQKKMPTQLTKHRPNLKPSINETFAVIIANENYTLAQQVPMAGNDGRAFAKCCEQTLGLPRENILQYTNATYDIISRAIHDIKAIADAYKQIRIIFFYAGLGVPNESTRDAYLVPIDADGNHIDACYSLKKLCGELSELNAHSVVVFLDTSFCGWSGDGNSLLPSVRDVLTKPHQEIPMGNMVVFNAASVDEPAYDYPDRGHGLFTYCLLKKLQESNGNTNLGDLASFIIGNVKQISMKIYQKIQTPTVSYSASIQNNWKMMKLR